MGRVMQMGRDAKLFLTFSLFEEKFFLSYLFYLLSSLRTAIGRTNLSMGFISVYIP